MLFVAWDQNARADEIHQIGSLRSPEILYSFLPSHSDHEARLGRCCVKTNVLWWLSYSSSKNKFDYEGGKSLFALVNWCRCGRREKQDRVSACLGTLRRFKARSFTKSLRCWSVKAVICSPSISRGCCHLRKQTSHHWQLTSLARHEAKSCRRQVEPIKARAKAPSLGTSFAILPTRFVIFPRKHRSGTMGNWQEKAKQWPAGRGVAAKSAEQKVIK